jgi:hypothetical protein
MLDLHQQVLDLMRVGQSLDQRSLLPRGETEVARQFFKKTLPSLQAASPPALTMLRVMPGSVCSVLISDETMRRSAKADVPSSCNLKHATRLTAR